VKKISLVFLLVVAISGMTNSHLPETWAQQSGSGPAEMELRFVSPIKGWIALEEVFQNYEIRADQRLKRGGNFSASARSKPGAGATGVAVIRQSVKADRFRGRQVQLSGWLKTDQVTGWSGLWLRIDGEQGFRLSLDNMQDRPMKGTSDWRQFELVLNVPETAVAVSFGLVLAGQGQVWMDDLQLEKISHDAPTTERYGKSLPRPGDHEFNRRRAAFARRLNEELKTMTDQPINLDFENP
jgi:hypothetical protein